MRGDPTESAPMLAQRVDIGDELAGAHAGASLECVDLPSTQTGALRANFPMAEHPLETWHRLARDHDASGLNALLAEDAVFYSPVVHTPQRGRALASGYLAAAFQV